MPLRREPFTISAGFRENCFKCNILHLVIPNSPVECKNCSHRWRSTLDNSWGLDHGTWSVLRHVYPDADIPVVQLSIDENKPASFHFEIGKKLAPLREEGILVVGSGNLVHNLHAYAWGRHMPDPYDWAVRFERDAKEMMVAGEYKPLIEYEKLGPEALLSIPTPDHYLPMLYVIATRQQGEIITFPIEGVDGGSISMLTVQVG